MDASAWKMRARSLRSRHTKNSLDILALFFTKFCANDTNICQTTLVNLNLDENILRHKVVNNACMIWICATRVRYRTTDFRAPQ